MSFHQSSSQRENFIFWYRGKTMFSRCLPAEMAVVLKEFQLCLGSSPRWRHRVPKKMHVFRTWCVALSTNVKTCSSPTRFVMTWTHVVSRTITTNNESSFSLEPITSVLTVQPSRNPDTKTFELLTCASKQIDVQCVSYPKLFFVAHPRMSRPTLHMSRNLKKSTWRQACLTPSRPLAPHTAFSPLSFLKHMILQV